MVKEVKYSPMIEQYLSIKKDYMDCIVFFRLGDFYEMFFDDAILASKILEITLTGKDAGQDERVPMCGIPYHANQIYAEKLIKKGHKIAIAEQVENYTANSKKIVERKVVKVLTPGTITDVGLQDNLNNYIASVKKYKFSYLVSYSDISTGEMYLTIFNSYEKMQNFLHSLNIKELIVTPDDKNLIEKIQNESFLISFCSNYDIPKHLISKLQNVNTEYYQPCAMLYNYAIKTQNNNLEHFMNVEFYIDEEYLKIDYYTKRNLEIEYTLRNHDRMGSLISFLDKTQTAMGSRMLSKMLSRPLIELSKIEYRQNVINEFINDFNTRINVLEQLKYTYDVERIISKIQTNTCNAKDLVNLKKSLYSSIAIKEILNNSDIFVFKDLANKIEEFNDLLKLLEDALLENPPFSVKEGKMIKPSFDKTLEKEINIKERSSEWLENYELEQKEKLNVKNLKVCYSRGFGYLIEISKSQMLKELPQDYERRQTLTNCERYSTKELKEFEDILLHSTDRIIQIEYDILCQIREFSKQYTNRLQELANILAQLDVFISLAIVSKENDFVKPIYNEKNVIVKDAFHPIIKKLLKDKYVTNDINITNKNILLITGPNMSGKSTYMRMLAVIIVLSQIGCFVPASYAQLKIFDAIYTRIGASDDLNEGKSTFMVEMQEANYAITNATKNSLILFDELGRGTSTYDGMAIAQAIIEYIDQKVKAVTLFSTHYHELIILEETLSSLKNIHVTCKEENNEILFLHKIQEGGASKSYGINVAQLAGLPKPLINRSKQILAVLETTNNKIEYNLFTGIIPSFETKEEDEQTTKNNIVCKEILNTDLDNLSSKEALDFLYLIKEKLR